MSGTQRWFAELAMLPGGLAENVTFEVQDGRFTQVTARTSAPPDSRRLPGVVLPGLANVHSQVVHRALRAHTHAGARTAWSWREQLNALINRLDPESLQALATATFAEMALAGITSVGEFHYLHHDPDGRAYADPNVMGKAVAEAASAAGIRLTLVQTLYLSGGLAADGHYPLGAVQVRYGDPSAEAWATRVSRMAESADMRLGLGLPSVQHVPRRWMRQVKELAAAGPHARRSRARLPLHIQVSSDVEENEACVGYYGCSPTRVLLDEGLVDASLTAIHASHLNEQDVTILGRGKAAVAFCPSTQRDGGQELGPARELLGAGARLAVGSERHCSIDLFEEMRAIEMQERVRSGERGQLGLHALRLATTAHDALGWPDAGMLRPGAMADAVAVRLDSVRTAGIKPEQILMAATAADVTDVAVNGRFVVEDGQHVLGDVARLLQIAIAALNP